MSRVHFASATDPNAQDELKELDTRMRGFYNGPAAADYFALVVAANVQWIPESENSIVLELAKPGMSVLDMGCGAGDAYRHLKERGVIYTGMDVSASQIARNKEIYGNEPTFIAGSLYEDIALPANSFDMVFSLHVLEHLVWPQKFLSEMFRLAKPGGLIINICPHFRPFGRIPSLKYGSTVKTLKQRIKSFELIGAIRHLYLRNVAYPNAIRREFPRSRFPFLINLQPSCFDGSFYIDTDAVHLTDEREVAAELERLGSTDIRAEVITQLKRSAPPQGLLLTIHRKL